MNVNDLKPLSVPPRGTGGGKVLSILSAYWLLIASVLLVGLLSDFISPNASIKKVGHFCSGTGYIAYIVLSVLLLHWARSRPQRKTLWWSFDVALCTLLCAQMLKMVTHLPRPSGSPTGFPSGHTAFAFALAWLVFQMRPRLGVPWFGAAISIGWSRVETHQHFAYQVFAGALLGLLLGWAVSSQPDGVLVPRCFKWKRRAASNTNDAA